jgi:hypothetical protein
VWSEVIVKFFSWILITIGFQQIRPDSARGIPVGKSNVAYSGWDRQENCASKTTRQAQAEDFQ